MPVVIAALRAGLQYIIGRAGLAFGKKAATKAASYVGRELKKGLGFSPTNVVRGLARRLFRGAGQQNQQSQRPALERGTHEAVKPFAFVVSEGALYGLGAVIFVVGVLIYQLFTIVPQAASLTTGVQ